MVVLRRCDATVAPDEERQRLRVEASYLAGLLDDGPRRAGDFSHGRQDPVRLWPRQPRPGATPEERLTYVRDVQLASLPFSVLTIAALVAFSVSRWGIILCTALLVLVALDAGWLTLKLKRMRTAESGQP